MQPNTLTDPHVTKTNKRKLVWGVLCLTAPTGLIVLALLVYAIINMAVTATHPTQSYEMTNSLGETQLFGTPPVGVSIANVILFVVGAISSALWLPALVIGLVLLATRKKTS